MIYIKKFLLFLLVFSSFVFLEIDAKPMKVVLLNPGNNTEVFWNGITDFLQAAVEDLGDVELEVLYSNRNHLETVAQAKEIVSRKEKPDYIITGNEKMTAGKIIKLVEDTEIKVFVFNNSFVNEDVNEFTKPRDTFKNWIGKFFPDNKSAGYVVAKRLIDECIAKNMEDENGKITLLAVGGARATAASEDRLAGMREAVKEYDGKVEVLQTVYTNWTEAQALSKTEGLLKRYANRKVSGIWVASDVPGFGSATAAKNNGLTVGKDILIGSVGWAGEAVQRVKEGTLVTTVGGHFMDGAWVMIMLYDYHNGKDFINDMPNQAMSAIDKTNVDKFLSAFSKQEWNKIDFNKFSKVKNPNQNSYDFSLNAVLKYLE